MPVVAVINQKGGSGKTTAAVALASAWAIEGRRVLLIDADPQGSALLWASAREGDPLLTTVALPTSSLNREAAAMAGDYDAVVIDGPPRADSVTRSALMAADLAVIPVQPSSLDLWAAEAVLGAIAEARALRPDLLAVFLLNRRPARARIAEDAETYLQGLSLPLLTTSLAQRVSYAEAMASGLSVLETDPRNAGREAKALGAELAAILGMKAPKAKRK